MSSMVLQVADASAPLVAVPAAPLATAPLPEDMEEPSRKAATTCAAERRGRAKSVGADECLILFPAPKGAPPGAVERATISSIGGNAEVVHAAVELDFLAVGGMAGAVSAWASVPPTSCAGGAHRKPAADAPGIANQRGPSPRAYRAKHVCPATRCRHVIGSAQTATLP
mmetsp:Transcript_46008/g.127773  ORF Transcript_46008/g.127773 Transcript_46008/m.127773 type:complete len:169 (-) Transcript_46008:7-513(-)